MDPNPYRSPASPPAGPAAPTAATRPTAVIVFGILNLVFGLLGICGTAASSAMFFVELPRDPLVPNPALELIESNPTYRTLMLVMIGIGLLASLALLVAGIGLLRSKPWGRTLSIGYAWYGIFGAIFGMIVNWVYLVQPMLAKWNPAFGPAEATAVSTAVSGILGGCFGMIYPIVLLVFMQRPTLRDWLAAGGEPGTGGLR